MLKWIKAPAREAETPQEYFSRLPVLETQRLTLRRLTLRDARDMYRYAKDPEVARHVLWQAHRDVSETRAYLRYILYQYHAGEPSSWGIVDRESGHVIGTIGFMAYSAEHRFVEIGYSLSRAHWGQGLMTEALQAVLAECLGVLGLNRVEAVHFPDNPSSGRVMEKCGMKYEGRMRGRILCRGAFRDADLWAITKDDWQRRK